MYGIYQLSSCLLLLFFGFGLQKWSFLNLIARRKMTELGFIKADCNNLPFINDVMVARFFSASDLFNSSEIKGVKTHSAGQKNYADSAVGYVQLKREGARCILKGKVCPEHKVRAKQYNVDIIVDEVEEEVRTINCEDCPASSGGCKHAVAFLMWLHRRSEEPSPTETECYWKKSKLSGVGTNLKFMTVEDFGAPPAKRLHNISPPGSFLNAVIAQATAKCSSMQLLKHFNKKKSVSDLSMHQLILDFLSTGKQTANEFCKFAKAKIDRSLCKEACEATKDQCNSKLWHELRYGRLTASRIYEAARCKTAEGSLVESITGRLQIRETEAMKRGKNLEKKVLEALEEKVNIKFTSTGLLLSPDNPIIGASPDAISDEMVVEIKCPSTLKAVNTYVKNGVISNKCNSQIQLQMHLFEKKKGIFCVTDPAFEINKEISVYYVEYDREYIEQIINAAEMFWCDNVFPILIKSIK